MIWWKMALMDLYIKQVNIDELKAKLEDVLNGKLTWKASSQNIVDKYSFQTIINSLKSIVQND